MCGVTSLERIYNLGTPDNHPVYPRKEAVNRVAVVEGTGSPSCKIDLDQTSPVEHTFLPRPSALADGPEGNQKAIVIRAEQQKEGRKIVCSQGLLE